MNRRHGSAILLAVLAALCAQGPTYAQANPEYNWSAGNFSAQSIPASLPDQAVLNLITNASKILDADITIGKESRARWNDGALEISVGKAVENLGVFQILHPLGSVLNIAGEFINTGTISRAGNPAGTALLFGGEKDSRFVNSGELEAITGAVRYQVNSLVFGDGTRFTGNGTHEIAQNATFKGLIAANAGVVLSRGNGIFTGEDVRFSGEIRVQNNTNSFLAGAWTISDQGTLKVGNATGLFLNGSASLNNTGVLDLSDQLTILSGDNSGRLSNAGTIRRSGAGTTSVVAASVAFENTAAGTILVDSGTLQIQGFGRNEGTIETRQGATFSGNTALTNLGLLQGKGMITLPSLVNSGVINPGASPGTLNIITTMTSDGFSQTADGTLIIEIESLSSFDKLVVAGTASLGGTLEIHRYGSYVPAVGHSFEILTSTQALSGTFSGDPVLVGFGSGVVFDVLYSGNSVNLHVAAVPEPEPWALTGIGLALVGWAARRRARGRHSEG